MLQQLFRHVFAVCSPCFFGRCLYLTTANKPRHKTRLYMGFKKIDKEFLLTDNSVNTYGFRLLTEGLQLAEVKKNPIGYYMHLRAEGVVVRWEDHRIDGDKLYAKPVVNTSQLRGEQTVEEIENGFLNAASVGNLVALEISEDKADYLPNQTGPTVKKWFYRECSLVDIPGNYNSLTNLVDENDKPINLADFTNPNKIKMDKPKWTAQQLSSMNLTAESNPAEISEAFNDLVAKAGRADQAETELNNLKASTTKKEVLEIASVALKGSQITKSAHDKLIVDYAENPSGLKDLLATMPKYKSIKDLSAENPNAKKLENLMAKSYDDLFKSGELEDLKAIDEESFKLKRAEKYPTINQ